MAAAVVKLLLSVLFIKLCFASESSAGHILRRPVGAAVKAQFEKWMQQFNIHFSGDEKTHRLTIFARNLAFIKSTNARNLGYTLEANKFAHLTFAEFQTQYLGLKRRGTKKSSGLARRAAASPADLPDAVDWREKGAVSGVKDQGQCGSSWAFSTTGAIEGLHFLKTGDLVSLSEQQLVDCCAANKGCNGGKFGNAYQYVYDAGGLVREADYNYTSGETGAAGTCNKNGKAAVTIFDAIQVVHNEYALKEAVAQQPVSVAIEANKNLQFYAGGLYWGPCGTKLNHAMLAVGYGSGAGLLGLHDYWIVKNSLGKGWGDGGYLKMRRNLRRKNTGLCGIALEAWYPTAD